MAVIWLYTICRTGYSKSDSKKYCYKEAQYGILQKGAMRVNSVLAVEYKENPGEVLKTKRYINERD